MVAGSCVLSSRTETSLSSAGANALVQYSGTIKGEGDVLDEEEEEE